MKKQDLNLTQDEIKLVQESLRHRPLHRLHDHSFEGSHIKFGYYSDPHVGEKHFLEPLWFSMLRVFKNEGVVSVYCPGDNLEGMSGRPGHIYELSHIGATAQLNYATSLFNVGSQFHFYVIDGNHDLWFEQKGNMGLTAGKELENRCKNVTFLGQWEANVKLHKFVTMKMFHSADGTAYADSYKLQKLIESFEGGRKPNLLLSGHYHKQVAIFRRNIFGFECGTLCGQTIWMRAKKLQAHKGFGIIEIWAGPRGVERLRHEFFPYYD